MSDTPIVDEEEDRCFNCGLEFILAADARRLERDRAELIEVMRESYDQIDCDTGDADLDIDHKLLKGRISALLARLEKE